MANNADDTGSPTTNSEAPVAKRRTRWLPRFGLSTVLSVMAIVSIVAAWWTRVAPIHFTFPDEVRVYSRTVEPPEGGEPVLDGDYHLVDAQGRVMIRGRNVGGKPAGVWTSYYESGFRSTTGGMKDGLAIGPWTFWSPNGHRRAVITYAPPIESLTSPDAYSSPKWRHGPALFWHEANGSQAAKGQFKNNERAGEWTFWDQAGQIVAEGVYADGRRHGEWKIRRDGKLASMYYVDDTPVGDPKTVRAGLVVLTKRIQQGKPTWRHDLAELKAHSPEAVELLIEALQASEPPIQSGVLLALAEFGRAAGAAGRRVQELLESPSQAVRRDAAICLLAIESDVDQQRRALHLIRENTHGPIVRAEFPESALAHSLDLELAEQIMRNQSPAEGIRIRRIVARIVARAATDVDEQGLARNDRVGSLVETMTADSDSVIASLIRQRATGRNLSPAFYW